MELKQSDIKLLTEVYHHNRESITKIAKKCKLSREQVEYKLKKFKETGIIKRFITIFNYSSLGYDVWGLIFLKIKPKEIQKFHAKLNHSKNIISNIEVYGNYDFLINSIFRDEKELNEFVADLLNTDNLGNKVKNSPKFSVSKISRRSNTINEIRDNNAGIIQDYLVVKPFFSEMYPLKFLDGRNNQVYNIQKEVQKKRILKDDEKKILKLLEKNARIRLIDIANKLNISAVLALHKLNKLNKDKIILGTRTFFDMEKLGYFYSDIILEINNFSTAVQEKLKKFAKNHKLVDSIILSLNKPNCIIQVFNKTQKELIDVIKEIKELLSGEIINIELMFPMQEQEINTLPFI